MPQDPTVYLAPHIHMARCHDDIVVLDVLADDYALLTDAAPLIRPGPNEGQLVVTPDVREDLLALGFLADRLDPARTPLPALAGDLPAQTTGLSSRSLAAAAFNSVFSSAAFSGTPFCALVSAAARRITPDRPITDEEIARAVGAFLAVHPWIPFEGDCLQRGFRLHHHLHRSGIPARWVFGVRTWPFLAHCWVQAGDRVVGDLEERVRSFSPILAV